MNIKISVITICYNAVNDIERTILSVLNQTYKNIEYIIIDGSSTDGTVDIIKKYSNQVDFWITEKDGGIYDAMNKGIDYVSGDYVHFLNAGDEYFDSLAIEKISHELISDVVTGRTLIYNAERLKAVIYPPHKVSKIFFLYSSLSHPSTFVRSNLLKNNKFNIDNKIVSDWEFFLTVLFIKKATYQSSNVYISKFYLGGVSTKFHKKTLEEREDVLKKMNIQVSLIEKLVAYVSKKAARMRAQVLCKALNKDICN